MGFVCYTITYVALLTLLPPLSGPGLQGLLATTDLHNRLAIHDYVETLRLDVNFSGIQLFGVVERVDPSARAAHVAAIRRLGVTVTAICYNTTPVLSLCLTALLIGDRPTL